MRVPRWLCVRGARRREEATREDDKTSHGGESQQWLHTSAPKRPAITVDMTESGMHRIFL
jgi:hypothetical protein